MSCARSNDPAAPRRADDQRELRRACTHFRNCATADGTCPREHDGLTISHGYGGRGLIQADLSSSALETVTNAIHALTDHRQTATPAPGPAPGRRPRAHGRTRPRQRGRSRRADPTRPAATIVIDWQTLTREQWAASTVNTPAPSTRPTSERLLCRLQRESGRHRPRRPPARRGPIPTDDPTAARPGPRRPRRRLSLSGIAPTPRLDPSPPHHPLERRRRDRAHQHHLVVRPPHHVVHQPGWTAKFDGHELTSSDPTAPESPDRTRDGLHARSHRRRSLGAGLPRPPEAQECRSSRAPVPPAARFSRSGWCCSSAFGPRRRRRWRFKVQNGLRVRRASAPSTS